MNRQDAKDAKVLRFSVAGLVSIAVAMVGLTLVYGLWLRWIEVAIIVALGSLWLIGQQRGWNWRADVGLAGFVAMAVWGVWRGLPALWMLFGVVTALVAWDLDHFARRVRDVERVDDATGLARAYLRRLAGVTGLGLLLGGSPLLIEVGLNFGWAFLLGLVLIVGLNQAISFMRRRSD